MNDISTASDLDNAAPDQLEKIRKNAKTVRMYHPELKKFADVHQLEVRNYWNAGFRKIKERSSGADD